mmetsp:Transcript_14519/g.45643  ORF Transcript_14519/g.45643 Transcript_14519/m.45643 type:complete len:177 (-) Transcript_14519:235-765(-)
MELSPSPSAAGLSTKETFRQTGVRNDTVRSALAEASPVHRARSPVCSTQLLPARETASEPADDMPEGESERARTEREQTPGAAWGVFIVVTILGWLGDIALQPCRCDSKEGYSPCGAWQDVRCLFSCLQGALLCHLFSVTRSNGGGAVGADRAGPPSAAVGFPVKACLKVVMIPFW